MLEETLVVALDFDGCADERIVREKLRARIVQLVRENPICKNVIVCIASLRQSVWLDFFNSRSGREEPYVSCSILGTSFVDALQATLGEDISVSFEALLAYDIYNRLEEGSTFQAMQQINYRHCHQQREPKSLSIKNTAAESVEMFAWAGVHFSASKSVLKELSMADGFKRDICHMLMQQISIKLGADQRFSFLMVDDKGDILKKLMRFLGAHRALIPSNCSFKGMQHCTYSAAHAEYIPFPEMNWIRGSGTMNLDFQKDMRFLRQKCLAVSNTSNEYATHYALMLGHLAHKRQMHQGLFSFYGQRVFSEDVADPSLNINTQAGDHFSCA